jgi:hypothetical protein
MRTIFEVQVFNAITSANYSVFFESIDDAQTYINNTEDWGIVCYLRDHQVFTKRH